MSKRAILPAPVPPWPGRQDRQAQVSGAFFSVVEGWRSSLLETGDCFPGLARHLCLRQVQAGQAAKSASQ
ncbi:MAG: hypothetical protein MUO30_01425 [Anaerolineales bacterium]|nr:hypothetical protein [Anaerolineales bacterium]